MNMTGGFGQTGGHHMRYQSQLTQQTKQDIQARMNMTISHGGYSNAHHTIQTSSVTGSHAPPQYPKNTMIGNHGQHQHHHSIGTAAPGMRPTKMATYDGNPGGAAGPQQIYQSVNSQNNNAWRAIDVTTNNKGHAHSA